MFVSLFDIGRTDVLHKHRWRPFARKRLQVSSS
jgi:hypothetical protein